MGFSPILQEEVNIILKRTVALVLTLCSLYATSAFAATTSGYTDGKPGNGTIKITGTGTRAPLQVVAGTSAPSGVSPLPTFSTTAIARWNNPISGEAESKTSTGTTSATAPAAAPTTSGKSEHKATSTFWGNWSGSINL